MARKKFFLYRDEGHDFFTSNPQLKRMRDLHVKWENRFSTMGMWWFFLMVFITPGLVFIDQGIWNAGAIIAIITGILYLVFIITYGIIAGIKTDKYAKYKESFTSSNEYKTQVLKYKKQYQREQDKIRTDKATRLVESYEILDNYKITKEEKIELIKKYIQ